MLSRDEARAYYDRYGARQDRQAVYEDVALAGLETYGAFEEARAVFELGCGTGRFARRLLSRRLPSTASYLAVDLSATMVALAGERLATFGDRVEVRQSDGEVRIPLARGSTDRVVSNYVLDLLPREEVRIFLAEAHRVLVPGGRLCLAGLTDGPTPSSRLVSGIWRRVHALAPARVGGCRPLSVVDLITSLDWRLLRHRIVVARGVASEVLVAAKR